jgi:hypothetical protein
MGKGVYAICVLRPLGKFVGIERSAFLKAGDDSRVLIEEDLEKEDKNKNFLGSKARRKIVLFK